jgi:hypothetical protein
MAIVLAFAALGGAAGCKTGGTPESDVLGDRRGRHREEAQSMNQRRDDEDDARSTRQTDDPLAFYDDPRFDGELERQCPLIDTPQASPGMESVECKHNCWVCQHVGADLLLRSYLAFKTTQTAINTTTSVGRWLGRMWDYAARLSATPTVAKILNGTPEGLKKAVAAGGEVVCALSVVNALIEADRYYRSGVNPERYYERDFGRAVCGVVYATSSCTAATGAAAAAAPAIPPSLVATLGCLARDYVAKSVVCNATRRACLSAIDAATPVAQAKPGLDPATGKMITTKDCCWCERNGGNTVMVFSGRKWCEDGQGLYSRAAGFDQCAQVTVEGDRCTLTSVEYPEGGGPQVCRRNPLRVIDFPSDRSAIGRIITPPRTPEWDLCPSYE